MESKINKKRLQKKNFLNQGKDLDRKTFTAFINKMNIRKVSNNVDVNIVLKDMQADPEVEVHHAKV